MKYRSVFDIIGPVMIGPSSSHTAGAARIGRIARQLFGRTPRQAHIEFCGSFAQTYQGHGTDVAIVGGMMNFDTHDPRIKDALKIAEDIGLQVRITTIDLQGEHPNTAWLTLKDEAGTMKVKGISVGGGKVALLEVDGFAMNLSGDAWTTLVFHRDHFGMIALVAKVLADHRINIARMEMSRKAKGQDALLLIETDQIVDGFVGTQIAGLTNVAQVRILPPL
ncbi:L-serine ammonia-lyase, iron-sulfur-dependent subunit beta [Paenibacillus lentus]|uniref:L-serine deaminase n=1 Tax=Paenibacillus lentus TaxID=1338368 RepID=A0A3S8S1Z9_9BACL|nr:L-serine ammonia-lyase, iron-sulfur-dependent subunit beta [Paenibacillus lentus]AZK49114.1 L-serine ammonia-lyase, iron-sulfur-dependent, subunit beta [Paenibacillus lentus]